MATVEVEITGPTIRLGQLLKLRNVVGSGGEVRSVLTEGLVRVNGVVEVRRGRQLHHADLVEVGETRLRVITVEGSPSLSEEPLQRPG